MDADAGAALASVKIVTPPALGTLALDGTAVVALDDVTKAQIDGDMLTFRPALNADGDAYTTFTFKVNDGTDDSTSAYTMTIDVTDSPAPVCTAPSFGDRREIWSGTVTVGALLSVGVTEGYGFLDAESFGELDLKEFDIGSNNHSIDAIGASIGGRLFFALGGIVSLTATETAALRLHVCDGDYDFSTATPAVDNMVTFHWTTATLDWSPPVGDPHAVSEPAGEPRRDGRAGDFRHGAGRAGADRRREPHHGHRRADRRRFHVPVDPG